MRAEAGARRWLQTLGALLVALSLGSPSALAGLQRVIQSRLANHPDSPVVVERCAARLMETYAGPGQFPFATMNDTEVRVKRSRVRYVNRLNQQIPTYMIEGQLTLHSQFRKKVAVMEVTTTFLNAFRERVGQSQYAVTEPLQPYETKTINWSMALPHPEVYEMFVVVTGVRFEDGMVWSPNEEAIIVP